MTTLTDYVDAYEFAELERRGNILFLRLHTDDGPLVWAGDIHHRLASLFRDIGDDSENWVLILTGAGDRFIGDVGYGELSESDGPLRMVKEYDHHQQGSLQLLETLLDLDTLVICAVNGPVLVHSELALLSDIVLASETASFQDGVHFQTGGVPGDGVHTIYPLLLGQNRARYFLLMGEVIAAREALELGLVGEVLPPDELIDRAWEVAERFAQRPRLTLRFTRQALTLQLKRALQHDLAHGLMLEGLARVGIEGAYPPAEFFPPGQSFARPRSRNQPNPPDTKPDLHPDHDPESDER